MSGWKKRGLVPSCLMGLGAAVLMTALFTLLETPLFLRGLLPTDKLGLCACAAAGLAVFIAVLLTARLRGRQAMPTAGIVAGGYVLLAALLCALGGGRCSFGPWLLRAAAFAASGALLGAVMSIKKSGSRRRRGH